jgi:[CysO sulfur-carrier protein]-S-L-cysteine hydrolase
LGAGADPGKIEMSALLTITGQQRQAMLTHVLVCLPEEACGILSGAQDGVINSVIPITNELHSQTAFRMDPEEQIRAFLDIEKRNQELIAVYHSHPNGPAGPSERDINQFLYPGVVQLIWSRQDSVWSLNGFIINGRLAREGTLNLVDVT